MWYVVRLNFYGFENILRNHGSLKYQERIILLKYTESVNSRDSSK